MDIFERRINATKNAKKLQEEMDIVNRIWCDSPKHSEEMKRKTRIISKRLSELLDTKKPSE